MSAIEGSAQALRYLGCQPILDQEQRTYGHELLFRSGAGNYFSGDGDSASRQVIDNALTMGLEDLGGHGKIFVNCTREALTKGLVTLLPAATTVLEILESVLVDDEVVRACEGLADKGYEIALDDYVPRDGMDRLLQLVTYVKLDFRACDRSMLKKIRRHVDGRGIALLAEKVETEAEFERSVKDGFSYFQGYYFSKPKMVEARELPVNKLVTLQLLCMVTQPTYDRKLMEKLLMAESSLCFRLLRLVKSAALGIRQQIRSIRQAMLMIGEDELAKLIMVASAVSLAGESNASSELVLLALRRARFCELLAPSARQSAGEQYLIGMVSVMDAMLMMPMETIVQMLPLRSEAVAVLKGSTGPASIPLRTVRAYEQQDWSACAVLCARMRVSDLRLSEWYAAAERWGSEQLKSMRL